MDDLEGTIKNISDAYMSLDSAQTFLAHTDFEDQKFEFYYFLIETLKTSLEELEEKLKGEQQQ